MQPLFLATVSAPGSGSPVGLPSGVGSGAERREAAGWRMAGRSFWSVWVVVAGRGAGGGRVLGLEQVPVCGSSRGEPAAPSCGRPQTLPTVFLCAPGSRDSGLGWEPASPVTRQRLNQNNHLKEQ